MKLRLFKRLKMFAAREREITPAVRRRPSSSVRVWSLALQLGFACLAALPTVCPGQSTNRYAISWSTVDAGGGPGSGGDFTLLGTLGQPDAGTSSGGPFTLVGGFWPGAVAIQEPGAPLLRITRLGSDIIISWPDPSTGFQLQETASLSSPVRWMDVSQSPMVLGGERTISVTPTGQVRYYRLRKQ